MARLGTFKLTDSGVTLSRRCAGVVLDVSFRDLEKWAKRNAVDEKRLYAQSYGRAVKGLRDKMRKIMSRAGGVEGVPKFKDFEEFTRQLRTARNDTAPMGGILAQRKMIIAYKRGDTQYIGWPDRLATWAEKFQDGVGSNDWLNDNANRHWLHRKGIHDIPRTYTHNERRVIPEPFLTYVRRHLDEWARGAFYKALARQMAQQKFS